MPPPGGLEDPPVRGGAVPLGVGAVLQAPLLPRGAVIGPGRARAGPRKAGHGRGRTAGPSRTGSDGS